VVLQAVVALQVAVGLFQATVEVPAAYQATVGAAVRHHAVPSQGAKAEAAAGQIWVAVVVAAGSSSSVRLSAFWSPGPLLALWLLQMHRAPTYHV
jgi:hypothetical protein